VSGDRCEWKRCRAEADMSYLGRAICKSHFSRMCEMQDVGREEEARKLIGLPPRTTTQIPPEVGRLIDELRMDQDRKNSAHQARSDRVVQDP